MAFEPWVALRYLKARRSQAGTFRVYFRQSSPMEQKNLESLIRELSPDEQTIVRDFILLLKKRGDFAASTPFLAAVDEFVTQHPELLRRLAQ